MIGYETERRLKDLLIATGEGEQLIERQRERLGEIRDFATYDAFQRLDRDANERISGFEILNFLRENRVFGVSERECQQLVQFFDTDSDGRLTFDEYPFFI